MEKTRRQQIRALLLERWWTLDSLAREFGVAKKVIIDDLQHIARSVAPKHRVQIQAPECGECGFRFKDRSRFNDPSRCPRCKNEHLSPQAFRIV